MPSKYLFTLTFEVTTTATPKEIIDVLEEIEGYLTKLIASALPKNPALHKRIELFGFSLHKQSHRAASRNSMHLPRKD